MTKKTQTPGTSKKSAPGWADDLLAAAKAVAATNKKMEFYHQVRREAPEHLSSQLKVQEAVLDAMVQRMLVERKNLKADVFDDARFDRESLSEVEFGYQKAVCFGAGRSRARSRMFFLPCVYWSNEDGSPKGVIDFAGARGRTFEDFAAAFLDEKFGDTVAGSPKVTVYARSVMDWHIQDEEEKMLPALHRAILEGVDFDLDAAFPYRAKEIAESQGAGWSVSVLPFAVEHDDEAWLESINFESFEEDFVEGFEEIFDPSSLFDYDAPCDPTMLTDQAVRLLWAKQLELIVAEMSAQKKPRHVGVIESTFVWEGGDYAGVAMDFKILDPESDDDGNEHEGVLYHRQLIRATLIDEKPSDLASFLAEYPALIREDFDLVFGHQFDEGTPKGVGA